MFKLFLRDLHNADLRLISFSVFGVKFVDDLLQRHVRPRNSDGSYTVRAIPSKVIGGLSEGTAFVEQMWTDPIPAWMLKREVSPKVSGRE